MARDIPVYVFTGFMDSGKTTLIQETLFENDFASGGEDKILILSCEDGEVEYDIEKLKTVNAKVATIDSEEDFNLENLTRISNEYNPDVIFLEYNGTWGVDKIYDEPLPEGWVPAQSLATVDATTFEMYLNNMRTMIMEQIFKAEVVIINRCTDDTPKTKFRGQIKSMNRPAQIVYERADGSIDDSPEELPFDINADVIEITDADYALWFMDCMETPKKYDGKTIHFRGLVYNPNDGKLRRDVFIPGRFAMTCCVEDIQFLGMKCKWDKASTLGHRSWIDITAQIKVEFAKEYKGKGPVLYPVSVEPAEKPEDELVYFS
ncbi:TIGR03943 family protein [Pseudobutyrivibrio sp. AR14]|uniref:TIGR03943 family putative permease subunit n=1 Tax=Pseudobutyrivibrio sp. AR14 TaxID=1520804 RepID=UPI00088FD9A0|nr:GTP-binding protein [Pseudobutyrivibrio sp. AR14]SCX83096.1 TIGR03943 family protein [Pseudobutyrivibrio sp. AR14]